MKARLKFFLSLALFWLALFALTRILFLIYQFSHTSQLSAAEILMPLALGLRMDLAMTGYWLLLPGLVISTSMFVSNQITATSLRAINFVLLLFTCLIVVVDMELYKHWGFRLNSTPLMYIQPEALSSASSGVYFLLFIVFTALIVASIFVYKKKIETAIVNFTPLQKRWSLVWLLITAALILPIRGSLGVAPMNTGVVYFHKTKAFPNHVGINPVWNFLKSVLRGTKDFYPDDYAKNSEGEFRKLMIASGDTDKIINVEKPNVLLIILESFTANIIEPLGGLPGVTPNLNALTQEGVFFTNFYASGDRTDKGIVSIISGYPAQPRSSIIKYPEKTQHLPYLTHNFKKLGYTTSFVYGGDISFANMKSYLTYAAFDNITDEDAFDSEIDKSKWGVADHFVFNQLMTECDTTRSPFFKVMLSLSSHEPFIVPMNPVFEGNDEPTKFKNAAAYTDQSLGDFIREAKTTAWWKNTLVIITADHGHRLPKLEELKEKTRFRIPMLLLGGAIKKDSVINTFASQTDIANTLLGQLNKADSSYTFSRNIFAKNKNSFAVYVFSNGYGYVNEESERIYDFDLKNYLKAEGKPEAELAGKAYMQKLFNDYNRK